MKTLLLIFLFVVVGGCTVLWTDDLFFMDVANNREIEDLKIKIDPNSITVNAKDFVKDPDDATVLTPGGAAGTKGGK